MEIHLEGTLFSDCDNIICSQSIYVLNTSVTLDIPLVVIATFITKVSVHSLFHIDKKIEALSI